MITYNNVSKYDVIWFGEIHGIRENYDVYRKLLAQLAACGFKNVLWEMPLDFSKKSTETEDGRINPFSVDFLEWLKGKIKTGMLENLVFFGNRKPKDGEANDYEKVMSEEMLEIVKQDKKYVVISGNYHMTRSGVTDNQTKKCIDYLEDKTGLKIITFEIKYTGGTFYNYGLKMLRDSLGSTNTNIETFDISTITENVKNIKLSVGKAHGVFKNPTAK